jgi:steroid 5-alpha reductase family enzyme
VHIGRRNFRKSEDDYRYLEFRRKWQPNYWATAYLRIFLLQGALLLVIGSSAVASIMAGHPAVMWLAVVGYAVWGSGIVTETVADWQLRRFVASKKPGQIMQSGLWRYSRHPNYFGEITSWWGAGIVAVSVQQWWGVVGALVITVLITKVSGIPPLEKHYADNPAFQKYAKHTSALIPLPRH